MKLTISILYVLILGIVTHYIGEAIPRSAIDVNSFPYKQYAFEKSGKIYSILKVRSWKARLPDMSKVMRDMLPKAVPYGATSKDISDLVRETCVAEFIHHLLNILYSGIYFIWGGKLGLALYITAILLNLPYIIVQRYNRPHLAELEKRLIIREGKNKNATVDTVV